MNVFFLFIWKNKVVFLIISPNLPLFFPQSPNLDLGCILTDRLHYLIRFDSIVLMSHFEL